MTTANVQTGDATASGLPGTRPRVTVAFIGTGRYFAFFDSFVAGCETFLFPGCDVDYLIFSDKTKMGGEGRFRYFHVPHRAWPYVTLRRFAILLAAEQEIARSDWFLFLDADMKPVGPILLEEVFDRERPLTGVRHPYIRPDDFPLERDPRSRACVAVGNDAATYWQGCLWGGRSDHALALMRNLAKAVAEDEDNRVMALWHDESHLNRYFTDHAPLVNTIEPAFAFPEGDRSLDCAPRILHVRKDDLAFGNTGEGKGVPLVLPLYRLRRSVFRLGRRAARRVSMRRNR